MFTENTKLPLLFRHILNHIEQKNASKCFKKHTLVKLTNRTGLLHGCHFEYKTCFVIRRPWVVKKGLKNMFRNHILLIVNVI